jgi:hypothetical protein
MTRTPYPRVLIAASCLTLLALSLMIWSLLEPTPMPVLVAMSLGQVLGTISLLAFIAVVLADLRQAHIGRELRSRDAAPPGEEP